MATEQEVQRVIADLLRRIGDVDEPKRKLLPSYRLVEIRCLDLDLAYYAEWRSGRVQIVDDPLERRPDIRLGVDSDDLVRIGAGEVSFARAYATGQVRIDASMTDLLRLRAAL